MDRSGIDNNTWYGQDGIESKLRKLGVMDMDRLPPVAEKWHEWMRRLTEKGDNLSEEAPSNWQGGGELWKAARSLYGEYLQQGISDRLPDDVKIPCVCQENGRRTLHFSLPHEVYWIDEPHLADSTLEKKLLEEYKLFIFRLEGGDKSGNLGVRKLSDAIKCQPHFVPSNDGATDTLSQRYEKRRIALEKVKKIKLPEAVDIKAVTNLSLELSAKKQVLGDCPVLSWRDGGTNPILVNIERESEGKKSEGKKWRALADALAHRLRDDEEYARHTNDFEVYLADDDDKSVLERVRNAGVPEEALEEVKNNFQQSMPNEQSEEETESESKDFSSEYSYTPPADSIHQSSEDEEETEQQITNYDGYEAVQPTSRNGSETAQNTDWGNGQSRVVRQRLSGNSRSTDPRSESGSKAEAWLEKQLRSVWPDAVKKVHIGRDFTLSVGGRTVHIEAKHVENPPGAIHWSDEQYKLASETGHNGDSYFIAVLSPGQDDDNGYAIHWIWDPLEHLSGLDRNVTWTWSGKNEPLQKGYWNMVDTRPLNVSPEKYKIEVKLTDDIFNEENQDGSQLEKLRARIESPQNSAHEASNAP